MIPVSNLFEEGPVSGAAPGGGGFFAGLMNKAKRFIPGARPRVPGSPQLGVRKLGDAGDTGQGGVGKVLSSIGKRNALLKAASES